MTPPPPRLRRVPNHGFGRPARLSAAGSLLVDAAQAIRNGLGAPSERVGAVTPDDLAGAVQFVVIQAARLDADESLGRTRSARDDLDEVGIADRERMAFELLPRSIQIHPKRLIDSLFERRQPGRHPNLDLPRWRIRRRQRRPHRSAVDTVPTRQLAHRQPLHSGISPDTREHIHHRPHQDPLVRFIQTRPRPGEGHSNQHTIPGKSKTVEPNEAVTPGPLQAVRIIGHCTTHRLWEFQHFPPLGADGGWRSQTRGHQGIRHADSRRMHPDGRIVISNKTVITFSDSHIRLTPT